MSEANESEIILRLLDALRKASGCAGQLAHHQQNPRWLDVRNQLEMTHTLCATMSAAKAVKRQAVLAMLDQRKVRVQ